MALPTEQEGKRLLRHAWEYGQRIERQSKLCKHALDLFGTELQALRRKLRDKCLQVILLGTTHCTKAEELLWKKSVYNVVQKCKTSHEAVDGASPLCMSYRNHMDMCIGYYYRLLEKVEEKFGVGPNNSPAEFKKRKLEWVNDVYYQCFIHLGDLARYQIAVGENYLTAVAYYHHAISLDPSKGASYNQLAALVGDKNEQLDAAYYYQRSVTSAQPFSGSLSNLTRIYDKNQSRLNTLKKQQKTTTEKDIKEFTKALLLTRFLRLQQMLQPAEGSLSSTTNDKDLEKLCKGILSSFEECLSQDFFLLSDTAPDKILTLLRPDVYSSINQEQPGAVECIPHDLMLKICALAILTSHTLRSLGSTFTPPATVFALSLFSQLLHYAHKRLSLLLTLTVTLTSSLEESTPQINECIEQGNDMVEILQKTKFDVSQITWPSTDSNENFERQSSEVASSVSKESSSISTSISKESTRSFSRDSSSLSSHSQKKLTERKKKRLQEAINHRRRRRGNETDSSDEDCDSLSNSSDSEASNDTLSALSDNLGEDDLEMLERLSDSSLSDDEISKDGSKLSSSEKHPSTSPQVLSASASPISAQKKGKRQIILAANFSNAPNPKAKTIKDSETVASSKINSPSHPSLAADHSSKATPQLDTSVDDSLRQLDTSVDDSLRYLMKKTEHQSVVHSVCSLVAEESYLMALRVFMEWIQSYPIAVTTSSQSSCDIWSCLATLLNFLPNEDQLSCLDDPDKVDEQFTNFALLEDIALKGFTPLISHQDTLVYQSSPEQSNTKQAAQRVRYFRTFGYFVADLRTVPSFSWDHLTNKFIGPVQKQQNDEKRAKEKEMEKEKQAQLQRSKLMNAMAQQKLQHEVATLEVSAKKQEVFFTPYLIPDALSLCTGLHLIKKLLATEKFIFVIAKSTIEALDGMKKGRDNFAAREVIKFLERELKDGHKFLRAQKTEETVSPGAKKPPKMELDIWYLDRLVDCAIYHNQSFNQRGQEKAAVTILLDKKLLKIAENPGPSDSEQVTQVIHTAWQHGLELDSVISFHGKWQYKGSTKQ